MTNSFMNEGNESKGRGIRQGLSTNQNKVSMCCGSKIDRPNSYYPICSECQAPIEKGGGECVEPNHSAGLHDRSCPDWKKPEYDTKAIERAAKQTHYYKEAHPEKINGAFQKLCLICRGECQKPRPHSFSMEEQLWKIAQIARERVKDEAFGKTSGETENSLDLTQTRQIIFDALSAAILAERDRIREAVEKKKYLEVAVDSCTLMWKQRMNRMLNEVLEIVASLK